MHKYLFGPVASRRLGISLGVNLLADCKECNLNCVYCELGRTLKTAADRKVFVPTEEFSAELKKYFKDGGKADFVTFSGNGEPCLALNLGEAIDAARGITPAKIALITNGTMFYDPQVRADAAKADVVMPSLDAATEPVFIKLNRPHGGLVFKDVIEGLIKFSAEFGGEIWAEVLLVKGMNDSEEELKAIQGVLARMSNVARVQINTVVRSAAETSAVPVDEATLNKATEIFGGKSEIIGKYKGGKAAPEKAERERILSALTLRPENAGAIALITGMSAGRAEAVLEQMASEGLLEKRSLGNEVFYIKK